jgi:hypothetical protein
MLDVHRYMLALVRFDIVRVQVVGVCPFRALPTHPVVWGRWQLDGALVRIDIPLRLREYTKKINCLTLSPIKKWLPEDILGYSFAVVVANFVG